MTVLYFRTRRCVSLVTFTSECGNMTVPDVGISPCREGIRSRASSTSFRFPSRIRFDRRRKKSHRRRAQVASSWETEEPDRRVVLHGLALFDELRIRDDPTDAEAGEAAPVGDGRKGEHP